MKKLDNFPQNVRDALIWVLAIIPGFVSAGLIFGYSMWGFIVSYWLVLFFKNILDIVIKKQKENDHD